VTGCNAVLLLARTQWQLRQLRNIRRDPPRLIFGEQLGGIGETQRSKTLAEKIYTHRENYSFFGRHGRLYGLVQLPSPHRRTHFANARLKGGPASLRAAPFLDLPRDHQGFCLKSSGRLVMFAAIRRASSRVSLVPGWRALLTAKPEHPAILQMTGYVQKQKMP
jgi:hypothetical protein